MASLIATACVVAVIGVLQQVVGPARLVELGYEYDIHVRFVGDRLRSFGTLDEPFAYAAFLLFGLAAVMMWMRRGLLAAVAGSIISIGLLFSFVRSAGMVIVALAALWLAKHGRMVTAGFLTAIVLVAAVVLILGEQAEQRRTVRGGDSVYITINGRTEAWKVVFDDPWDLPLGKGVGEVGTAAERATFSISRTADEARQHEGSVVDSGYFATVADIGLVGLAALLFLLGRLVMLGYRATRVGERIGWLTLSFLAILLLDAVTRESFSGFPTAFLGLLIVGLTLAAAVEGTPDAFRPPDRPRIRAA
jgi:O-antigen ligase